jgi:pimeloyl-ACP methyl ester carboxylesterase
LATNFYGYLDMLSKLENFIKFFTPKPSYYGYSMGGRVALALAINNLRPEKLILESAGFGLEDEIEKAERLLRDESLFNNYSQNEIYSFLIKWYENPMFDAYSKLSNFKEDCKRKSFHDYLEWKNSQKTLSIGVFPTLSKVIANLRFANFPITYLYGEKDTKFKDHATLLENLKIPNLEIIEISGAGHNPHKTHPMETTTNLINKLK